MKEKPNDESLKCSCGCEDCKCDENCTCECHDCKCDENCTCGCQDDKKSDCTCNLEK